MRQRTLKEPSTIRGVGLHSGRGCAMTIRPAPVDSGIVFSVGGRDIPALYHNVSDTRLSTTVSKDGASVSTIEHVMAALFMRGVTNARVALEGAEIPIVDGSAKPLVERIAAVDQDKEAKVLRVLKTVLVQAGDSYAMLEPADDLSFNLTVEYKRIPRQTLSMPFDPETFIERVSPARTFCMWSEILLLWLTGKARGGSLKNAVVVGPFGRTLNRGGWRMPAEAAAHKTLDAVGDLFTSGYYIAGKFTSHKGGHGRHNQLLRALFADPANYEIKEK